MKQLAILFISLIICFHSIAQLSFVRDQNVQVIDDSLPLKNAWAGGLNYPMFWPIDLNGDGIMDLVVYEPGGPPGHDRIMPFLNNGDSGQVDYHYAPQYIDLFPPDIKGWISTYDYNCDGKMDLFTLASCYCGIEVYRNDYTQSGGLKFTKVADPLYTYYGPGQYFNIPANSVTVPAFGDVDNDGAMDIVGWIVTSTAQLGYYRGLWVDSGWTCDSLRFNHVTDCWGGLALSVGINCPTFGITCREMQPDSTLLWDTGTAYQDDTISCICLYNQDDDIDKDLLIGGFNDNNVAYAHNNGTIQGNRVVKDSFDYANCNWPVYSIADTLVTFPCSYHLDVDNDTLKDMIVAASSVSDYRGVQYYKDVNAAIDSPIFIRQPHTFLQEEMIEVGTAAAPQIFDVDCDGLPDLLIGDKSYYVVQDTPNIPKGIAFYKNIGTSTSPKFKLQTRDFAGINELNGFPGGTYTMTFGDINGDGYPDMIVGANDGKLYYFQNTGGPCNPMNFIPPPGSYMNIDVGEYSAPQLYDLDHDGKLDLIVGNSFGLIKYFRNTGTTTSPSFGLTPNNYKDTLGGIITVLPGYTSGYASPVFYNDSGVDKLIVGTESGKIYVYDNVNGNIFGNYNLVDSLINGEEGANLIPAIGDLDNDGHPDMIVGNNNGGVALFMNSFDINGINEVHNKTAPTFSAYPNPAADVLNLNFNHTGNSHSQVEIINSVGQLVYKATVRVGNMTIPVNNLSNGIYLVRFVSSDSTQSIKIIISH